MHKKSRGLQNFFLLATLVALISLVTFVAVSNPAHFTDLMNYIKHFIVDRPLDAQKVFGLTMALIGAITAIVWMVRNFRAGRKMHAIVDPIIVVIMVSLGLMIFRARLFVSDLFASPVAGDRAAAMIMVELAILVVIFLLISVVLVIIEEVKDRRIMKVKTVRHDERDCCCEQECENQREVIEIKELVNEIRDILNEKGLQGRKVLVKKVITEEVPAEEEIEKVKVVSPIPGKEEPVAVFTKEEVQINPVNVEEPIEVEHEEKVSKKVIRRPFDEKMATAEDLNKENYNILKNELLSYGIKSRISHSGDTFRFKRETYAKITLVGKNLKIYLALNPTDYNDSTIPAKDVSAKKCFAEVPTMLGVKSRLSVKRAKMLIAELMKAKELAQKQVEEVNYAKEFTAPKAKKGKAK